MSNGVRTLTRATILLAAVILVALVVASAVVRLPSIQHWVAAQVAARLPPGVSIESAMLMLLPPGVRLSNVSLATDGPVLTSVACYVRVPALLAGRIEIASIAVDGATLFIERAADGELRVAGTLAPMVGAAPSAGAPTPPAALALDQLPRLTASRASITFVDHAARGGPHTLRLTDVRFALGEAGPAGMPLTLAARLDPAGSVSVQGSVRLVAAAPGGVVDHAITATATAKDLDAHTVLSYLAAVAPSGGAATAEGAVDGSLTVSGSMSQGVSGDATLSQSSGTVVWDEIKLTAPLAITTHLIATRDAIALSDARLTIAHLDAARISATDISAGFGYAAGTLRLTSAVTRIYGGTWSQSGSVTLAEPPHYDMTAQADGIACEMLLTAVTGERPDFGCERLNANLAVHGAWTGAESVVGNAVGSGHVELRGGTIPASSIVGAVWRAFVPVLHISGAPRTIGAATRVDHLTQSFALSAGRMQTSDLSLVTDDYLLTGAGSVGLDGTLDLNTEVAMTPGGVTKLLTMASLPIPGGPRRLPPIATRITGTLAHPIIRPEIVNLPVAAVSTLFRGAGQALGDAGSGLNVLEQGIDRVW